MQAKVARNQTSTFLVLRKAEQGSNRGAEYRREDGIASSWRTRMCSMKQEAKTSAKAKLWYFTLKSKNKTPNRKLQKKNSKNRKKTYEHPPQPQEIHILQPSWNISEDSQQGQTPFFIFSSSLSSSDIFTSFLTSSSHFPETGN